MGNNFNKIIITCISPRKGLLRKERIFLQSERIVSFRISPNKKGDKQFQSKNDHSCRLKPCANVGKHVILYRIGLPSNIAIPLARFVLYFCSYIRQQTHATTNTTIAAQIIRKCFKCSRGQRASRPSIRKHSIL